MKIKPILLVVTYVQPPSLTVIALVDVWDNVGGCHCTDLISGPDLYLWLMS